MKTQAACYSGGGGKAEFTGIALGFVLAHGDQPKAPESANRCLFWKSLRTQRDLKITTSLKAHFRPPGHGAGGGEGWGGGEAACIVTQPKAAQLSLGQKEQRFFTQTLPLSSWLSNMFVAGGLFWQAYLLRMTARTRMGKNTNSTLLSTFRIKCWSTAVPQQPRPPPPPGAK